jgi:hypothetical protein
MWLSGIESAFFIKEFANVMMEIRISCRTRSALS